jgi:O-acetyl-ADP-ribose deacetylase (regulator of RNase III)
VRRKVKIGNGVVEITKGDITEAMTEAIVNAANNHFWMGAGVASAIKRKGGIEIEWEAVSKGPVKIGEAVITGAGKLKAKYVIHAAGMGQDLRTDAQKAKDATKSSLELAESHKISSMAFPAIGTGVGGFPLGGCAEIMVGERSSPAIKQRDSSASGEFYLRRSIALCAICFFPCSSFSTS